MSLGIVGSNTAEQYLPTHPDLQFEALNKPCWTFLVALAFFPLAGFEVIMDEKRPPARSLKRIVVGLALISAYPLSFGPVYSLWVNDLMPDRTWRGILTFYEPVNYAANQSRFGKAVLHGYLDVWKF